MTLEREDIGSTPDRPADGRHAPARRTLWRGARRLRDLRRPRRAAGQASEAFTEGRSARDWLRHLYDRTARRPARQGPRRAGFRGVLAGRRPDAAGGAGRWRHPAAPSAATRRPHPLPTPSGQDRDRLGDHRRLRLCRLPGPSGLAAAARTCRRRDAPLRLVANQPATRLHSQFDFGGHSDEHEAPRAGGDAHPSRRCRGARHRRWRHRPAVQRARRLPRRGRR